MSESRGIDYKHRIRRKNRTFCQYCWGCALRPTIATAEAEGRAQGRIGSRSSPISPLFFNTFILWNNSVVTNLRRLFYAVFHVLRGLRPQDAGTPSFLSVLTLESDSGPAPTVQPPPKSLQTTRYCNFLTHFIISIALLENVPPDAGLQKRATLSTLNVGLAGTGNRTRSTCVASSVARRSAIHYAS
jgi:hypothetical protein